MPPTTPADTDYDAICAAVTATARGRWFLDEYAKRNRNSDTLQVLAAIARMEATVVGERVQQASREAHQEVRIELLEMARAIAQARAEVAESTPLPSQPAAEEPAGAAAPDVAAAAERLRQIAWTMRACGVEVVASEQIGQIADTILSADALRNLGEQRAHKLTEALHTLERRIDRMLDGRVAAADGPGPAPPAALPQAQRQDTAPVAKAMALIAAALKADGAETTATEPARSPAPTRAAAAALAQDIAPAASDATEYPMDDDVVLTVTDSAVEPEPALAADSTPDPIPAPPTDANAPDLRVERAELELEPLTPALPSAAEDEAETDFTELDVAPLVVGGSIPSSAHSHDSLAPGPSDSGPESAEAPGAKAESGNPGTLSSDWVPAFTGTSGTQVEPSQPSILPAAAEAASADAPPPAAAPADPIAIQVDHDLDVLTEFTPDDIVADDIVTDDAHDAVAPPAESVGTRDAHNGDPADLRGETPPHRAPVSDIVADAQASRVQLSDTLAAIESELFGSTRPATPASPSTAVSPATANSAAVPVASGPLAALRAMNEEERIALFS